VSDSLDTQVGDKMGETFRTERSLDTTETSVSVVPCKSSVGMNMANIMSKRFFL
jgi:hypothetical protein